MGWYLTGPAASAIFIAVAVAIATLLATLPDPFVVELERAPLARRLRAAPGSVLAIFQSVLHPSST
jgi:hypothetical protein